MPSSLTVAGLDSSSPLGQRVLGPLTLTNSQDTGETIVTALAQGDNTFTIPAGATAVVLYEGITVGGTAPTATLTVRFSGPTGLPVSNVAPTLLALPASAPTTLIVNASQAQSAPPLCIWFN